MRHPNLPVAGTCRCTATQFEILTPPILTVACHCADCQKLSASAFSLTAMIPSDGFRLLAGSPVAKPLPQSPRLHHFCPTCMTWIYTKIAGSEDSVRLRPTLLNKRSWCTPFIEMMTRDRLPWATTPARHSFEDYPSPDELPDLLGKYASWAKAT